MSKQHDMERVVSTWFQLNVNSMSGPTVSWKIVSPSKEAETTKHHNFFSWDVTMFSNFKLVI